MRTRLPVYKVVPDDPGNAGSRYQAHLSRRCNTTSLYDRPCVFKACTWVMTPIRTINGWTRFGDNVRTVFVVEIIYLLEIEEALGDKPLITGHQAFTLLVSEPATRRKTGSLTISLHNGVGSRLFVRFFLYLLKSTGLYRNNLK